MAEHIPGLNLTADNDNDNFDPWRLSSKPETPSTTHSLDSLFESPPPSAKDNLEVLPRPFSLQNVQDTFIAQQRRTSHEDDNPPNPGESQTAPTVQIPSLQRLNTTASEDGRNPLLHSKSYLSDLTPDAVQSHHPSIISRSPNRSASRPHSMAEVMLETQDNVVHPLTEEALAFNEQETLASRPEVSSFLPDHEISGFKKPLSAASQSRSFTIKTHLNSIDAASNIAVRESPATTQSGFGSRPDTPRPSVSGLLCNHVEFGHQPYDSTWCEASWRTRSEAPSPSTEPELSHHSMVSIDARLPAVEARPRPEQSMHTTHQVAESQETQSDGRPWSEPTPANDILDVSPSTSHPPDPLTDRRYSWKSSLFANHMCDPFVTGADHIELPSVAGSTSSSSGPIVLPKRGKRGQTDTDQAIQQTSNARTHGLGRIRATSKPPTKTNNQLGVQGAAVKVRKRSVSRARSASRNLKLGGRKPKPAEVPEVPPIPDQMDLDQVASNLAQARTGVSTSKQSTPSRSDGKARPKKDTVVSTPEALATLEQSITSTEASPSRAEGRILRSSPRLKRDTTPTAPVVRTMKAVPPKSKPKGIIKGDAQTHKGSRRPKAK